MNERISIIGGSGFIGSSLIRRLNAEQVINLDKRNSTLLSTRIVNITDPATLKGQFDDSGWVVLLAAEHKDFGITEAQYFNVNVEGTRNVVNTCLALGIKRLVHISSVAALGRQKGQVRIDENNKWVSNALNTVYAESKYASELEVFRGQEEGLSTVILNPSAILAPANWDRSSAQIFKYSWEEKPFITDGFLNFVDARDVASIACQLLHHKIEGERFIVSAGNISYENFFGKTAKQFNKKPPHIKLGKTLLNVLARIEGVRTLFTSAEPIMTLERARLSGSEFLYESQKIKNLLHFEFQSIDETLQWCCEYYIKENQSKKIR